MYSSYYFTCTHMHAHTNVWCNMLESHLTMSAAGENNPQRENKTTQSNSCDNALVQSAGVDCLTSLCQLLERMILRGRIKQHNPMYYVTESEALLSGDLEDEQSTLCSCGIDPGPSVFGVVHRIHDDPTHTDQQMYSCGSLAPKMRRGGCMDSHYHKLGEPWEKSEGSFSCWRAE
ncbi:uncharacterized protein LOC135349585 isoform X2 [Halichondria panicea]|uniref:uncharacterized protein LOC135349585 isoform X2 n=1 Tax=Halichondria panicea TaxID=6063 RepID=UPI00312B3B63